MGGKFFNVTGQAGWKTGVGGLEGAVAGSEEAARAARGVQLTCLRRCSLSSVSGRLTELPPEHLRLLGSLETLSSAPRPLPWQRRSAPPYPRGGVGSAPRPGGGTGSVFTGLRGAAFRWVAAILPLRRSLRVESLTLPPYRLSP